MTTFDLVLRGGRVIDPEGIRTVDLAIAGGRVAALIPPGETVEAAAVHDVGGKLLLPGLVDAHVHMREPGLAWKEDFHSGTRAAIAGGVTTILVMPTDDPWTSTAATFDAKRDLATGRIHCDAGLQVAVGRDLHGLEALAGRGASSFEIFTADVPDAFLHATPAALRAAVAAVHAAGGMSAVSPGDQSILEAELARLSPGRSGVADFLRTRPGHAEAQGIARAALVATEVGAPVHIRQSNSQEGIATFRRLRDRADVSIETSPQGLMFTSADYDRLGPEAKASPPWRTAADRAAVRAAVADGTIDMIVTDHAPHGHDEKMAHAYDFAAVPGGFPGLQTLLATLLALVDEGLIGLTDLVRLAATRPASRFGLGARKGRLRPGFDADILVVDPARPSVVRRQDQRSKSDFTPFEGLTVSASLEQVFLRGQAVDGSGTATGRVLGGER